MTGVYVQVVADLDVEVQRGSRDALVRLSGDLDKLTAPLLKDTLVTLFTEGRVQVVIDAGRLEFCDSSGLWVLVEHRRRVAAQAGSLGIVGVHGVLHRVLDVTGLRAAFDRVDLRGQV
ncbi:STAS domain-containing protein [Nonomuraea sp. NPDC004580]|uniref:STAS domain-containing protein n=1 Tax=Nonomuraea sp. NPDC004580 TaxID=3154552 RepID=UPI0033B06E14